MSSIGRGPAWTHKLVGSCGLVPQQTPILRHPAKPSCLSLSSTAGMVARVSEYPEWGGAGDAPPCSLHLQWPPLLPHWDDLQPWLLSSIAKPAVSCGLPFSLCPSHSLPLILLPLLQSYQSLSLPVSYQDHQGPFSHPRLRRVQGYLTALGSPEWREQPPSTETLGLCPISPYAAY